MTATSGSRHSHRVVCADFTKSFRDEDAAQRWMTDVEVSGQCRQRHTVEVLVDGAWLARHIARAREILAAAVGTRIDTPDGPLIIAHAGWSRQSAERPAARAADAAGDVDAYLAALGAHDHATLTADGRGARTDGWCQCEPGPPLATTVRYERWTDQGRVAHGYLCPTCRFITQTG